MKNITVFTVLVIIIYTFFSINYMYCDENNRERTYVFSIGPQTGIIYGQAIEIVYPSDTPAEFLSRLDWDMKSVFYYGIFMDFKRNNMMEEFGFYSSLSFKAGIPVDSGSIENRDWISKENEELTHYSTHTNRTRQLYMLDISLGASYPLSRNIYILPHLHFSWMHFSFSGSEGHGTYARQKADGTFFPINDEPITTTFEGEVIRYRQDWLLLSLGFALGMNILPDLNLDFSFRISPLTYCTAVDNHLHPSKVVTYRDFTGLGLFIEPALGLSFTPDRFNISLNASYRHITRTIGASYYKEEKSTQYTAGGNAGAALSIIDCRLLFGISF